MTEEEIKKFNRREMWFAIRDFLITIAVVIIGTLVFYALIILPLKT